MDRYGVFGNPIGHSKSPQIHALFAAQTGQALSYEPLLAPLDDFPRSRVTSFAKACQRDRAVQGAGLSHGRRADRARRAGAVNTLKKLEDGRLLGDNTDGARLVADLLNAGVTLSGRRILLLGAGVPCVAYWSRCWRTGRRRWSSPIAPRAGPNSWCRSSPSSVVVGERLRRACRTGRPDRQRHVGQPRWRAALADSLIVAGRLLLRHDVQREPTPFCRWAAALGATTRDGLGMLVEQAAEAFELWRGVRPDTAPVLAELRRQLG